MRRVAPPDLDGILDYDRIAQSKEAPRNSCLMDLRARIDCAYARYRACAPEMTDCEPLKLSDVEGDVLRHCYESKTDARDSMLARIPRQRWCPLCNLPNAKEWDHYLPRALFPEYSVYPQNLVRVCSDCNHKKRDVWRDQNGDRFVLHAYYDWIDRDEQIVYAQIDVVDQVVRVAYEVRVASEAGRFRRMRRHINRLDLLDRYRSYAEEIAVPDMLAQINADDDVADVEGLFRRMSVRLSVAHGANHWQAVAYQAAAYSYDFIQHALECCRRTVTHD